jgi:hypothetical protein
MRTATPLSPQEEKTLLAIATSKSAPEFGDLIARVKGGVRTNATNASLSRTLRRLAQRRLILRYGWCYPLTQDGKDVAASLTGKQAIQGEA